MPLETTSLFYHSFGNIQDGSNTRVYPKVSGLSQ